MGWRSLYGGSWLRRRRGVWVDIPFLYLFSKYIKVGIGLFGMNIKLKLSVQSPYYIHHFRSLYL